MKKKWTITEARYRFAEVIESSVAEPQPIYKRGKLTAVLVDAQTFAEFLRWREKHAERSIADATDELRQICKEDGYEFATEDRRDRTNPLVTGPE